MKRLLAIATLFVMSVSYSLAQSVSLGIRVPDIHLDSELGKELEMATKDYVYLVFVHSESSPSIALVESLSGIDEPLMHNLDVVLVTPEDIADNATIVERFADGRFPIAYDIEHRTFRNFGISYVPFGVIYDAKRNRALWFGSTLPFDDSALMHKIGNQQKKVNQ